MTKEDILKQYFGHSSFRYRQAELIDNILCGRDCLGVMPTGAGKSMCYQIPALMSKGTTIVISPLISLMKDQVEGLIQSGVSAAFINSSMNSREYFATLDYVASGECSILYVAPERLMADGFLNLCRSIRIPLIAVDEAHCVSHWGQDFRPAYLKISEFVKSLPVRPVIAAFTATATDAVKKDITEMLGLINPFKVTTGFDRSNLYFEVRRPQHRQKDSELLDIISGAQGRNTVIYCSTRKNVEKVCDMLNENGYAAARYHAGLPDYERKKAQEDFIYDRINIIVATNAFGMGIDKSDVSLVIHYNMPKDVESYYQEAGRAGRDGSPARCIMLYTKGDVRTNDFLIEHSHDDSDLSSEEIEAIKECDRQRLKMMTFYSTTNDCLRQFMLHYFGEHADNFCGNCSNCNANFDTADITVSAQKILSCIFRMKQINLVPDKNLLADTLIGAVRDKAVSMLSTYGIMKDTEKHEITEIIDYLTENGYIRSENNGCFLTELSGEFIRSRRTLLMRKPKSEKTVNIPVQKIEKGMENPELMAVLKELRKKLAAAQSVPAYIVFSDATLREMSVREPVTIEEFLQISGVGEQKAQRYGKKFTEVIAKYKENKA